MSIENPEQSKTLQTTDEPTSQPEPMAPEVAAPPPRGQRKWLLPGGIVLGLLLLGGLGWYLVSRLFAPLSAPQGPMIMPVETAPAKSGVITNSSDYVASLQSRQSVTLQPRVSGQISAIYVRAGDRVDAGTTVLQIDPREQEAVVDNRLAAAQSSAAEVDAARADAANTRSTLRSLQAQRASRLSDVRLNRQEYERFLKLLDEGATSQQVVDQRLNSLQVAQAELEEIEAQIRAQQSAITRAEANIVRNQRSLNQAQANIAEQRAQLNYYSVAAPFSGTIGNIPVKVGDFVSNSTPLLTLNQNQELEVEIAVPIEDAPRLRQGLPVQLLDANSKLLKTGSIFFISPNVNVQNQSVLVKATFENSSGRLRTDQFVRARIIWSRQPNGVLVPVTAISRLAGQNFIFVSEPYGERCKAAAQPQGTQAPPANDQLVASQRPVKLGKIVGNDQEVLSGLQAGDEIVVKGILQLQNCSLITNQPPTQ